MQPKVINAINRPFPNTVEIHFDQILLQNSELLNPSNYTFDHGAFTLSVEQIDEKQIRLVVENLFDFDFFIVSVNENVKGITGESVDQSNNSFSFPLAFRPKADDKFLSITTENGRLRSGITAKKVTEDADNWYILTESGFDVVDKVSLTNKAFFLDGYGFSTIHVG